MRVHIFLSFGQRSTLVAERVDWAAKSRKHQATKKERLFSLCSPSFFFFPCRTSPLSRTPKPDQESQQQPSSPKPLFPAAASPNHPLRPVATEASFFKVHQHQHRLAAVRRLTTSRLLVSDPVRFAGTVQQMRSSELMVASQSKKGCKVGKLECSTSCIRFDKSVRACICVCAEPERSAILRTRTRIC